MRILAVHQHFLLDGTRAIPLKVGPVERSKKFEEAGLALPTSDRDPTRGFGLLATPIRHAAVAAFVNARGVKEGELGGFYGWHLYQRPR